jgi:hypothetical protein
VIFLTSGLLLGCAIVYGVAKPATHSAMVATLGVLVAAELFLVVELSHPFIGEIATSPEPLREVIQVARADPATDQELDDHFAALLMERGFNIGPYRQSIGFYARSPCRAVDRGVSADDIWAGVKQDNPNLSDAQAIVFTTMAMRTYCPP